MVFTREVDTRAVDFNNGDGSIVDLDCRDGKKCRDGDNTEDVGFNFEFHLTEDPPAVGMVPG